MELLPPPLPLPLSTDDASNLESEQQPLDTSLTLIGIDAPKRCVIHDNRNRKNMVPFLKSNYKYKRRIMDGRENGIPQVNYSLTAVKQVEVERFQYLQRSLSDSYFEVAAFGFIRIMSTVILFRDILWNFVRRIARESRVWCVHRLSRHCLNEMSGEVKSFTSGSSRRWRFGVTAATLKRCSKSFGLRYVNASLKLIYLTLFIALWMTLYEVEAGTCWMDRRDNGKCETVYSKNMTKAQCCGENQLFSYTEKNLSDVEYFFALALGGGTECVPCLESCKDIVCGPNKRCVKRKGHPKCVCSPQCGSGKKHKKAQKRKKNKQQHIHQQNGSLKPPHVIDVGRTKEHVSLVNFHSPITVRDVRSLSSEIHSNPSAVSAMVVTSPGDTISQSNSRRKSQRIPISTDPTKKQVNLPAMQQHRIHHHHHHHDHHHHQHDDRLSQLESQEQEQEQEHPQQQQQQEHLQEHHTVMVARRRHANTDRNKGDKLIIIADDLVQPSTERDNDLAESNSLRDGSTTTSAAADNHHRHHQQKQKQKHHQQQQQQQNGRHHFKKHAKPKRKITDQNGASHNSVHNRTATNMLTQTGTFSTANRNEMKMAERRRHRTQSLDGFSASFASPSSSSSSSSPDHRFRQHKSTPQVYASNSFREQHLGQDYADDLAFDDKIHNGFFSNGFPYPHQELSPDEGRYTHPVCGSDGRTYNTECQLKKRACRTDNSALVVAYRGHCQTSCKKVNCLNGLQCVEDHYAIPHCIVCSIKCPIDDNASQIDPARAVCGVDGNTYKSTCDINRMVCKIGRSIAVAYPGPCREDRTSCDSVSCGPRMTCLTDLVTHRPRCVSCKFKCSRKRRPANIRYEEGKLCGTNNRTYYSWCEMKKDSCQTGFFIDIKSIGECQTEG